MSAPTRRCHRRSRSASCSTRSTRPRVSRQRARHDEHGTSRDPPSRCRPSTRATSSRGSDPARAADGPWSFDAAALAGARAFIAPRHEPPPFLAEPLPPAPDATWSRSTSWSRSCSGRCARSCASGWVSRCAATRTRSTTRCRSSSTVWSAGASASGCSSAGSRASIRAPAYLPRSPAGRCRRERSAIPVIEAIWPVARTLADVAEGLRQGHRAAARPDQPDPARRHAADRNGRRYPRPHRAAGQLFAAELTRHRLAAWVRLLALTAAAPGDPVRGGHDRARADGPARSRSHASRSSVAIPASGRAPRSRSSSSWRRCAPTGLRAPLPLPCDTALAYAEAHDPRRGSGRRRAAQVGFGLVRQPLHRARGSEPEHRWRSRRAWTWTGSVSWRCRSGDHCCSAR